MQTLMQFVQHPMLHGLRRKRVTPHMATNGGNLWQGPAGRVFGRDLAEGPGRPRSRRGPWSAEGLPRGCDSERADLFEDLCSKPFWNLARLTCKGGPDFGNPPEQLSPQSLYTLRSQRPRWITRAVMSKSLCATSWFFTIAQN